MQDNVNQMLSNIDKSQNLESTSQELADSAKSFHRTAVRARRHFWLQNLKFKLAVCLMFVIVLIIILAACGAFNGAGGGDDSSGGEDMADGTPPPPPPAQASGRRLLFGA